MKFTGERYVSDLNSAQISYEHWHRYFYATQFVKGKDVLDIACGEGYGAHLMAQTAKTVVGVDISKEAIDFAKDHYPRSNLSFLQGSVENIPIAGVKKFDVVVSFETIEHVNETAQKKFLCEVKRLLKDTGVFIVSSPNKLFYSDIPKYKNEFHIKELYGPEFTDFLKKRFANVSILGQRIFAGSNMWSITPLKNKCSFVEYELSHENNRFQVSDKSKQAIYFIAVCSDVKNEEVGNSFLVDSSLGILVEKNTELAVVRTESAREIAERDGKIVELINGNFGSDKSMSELYSQLKEAQAKITDLTNEAVNRGKWALGLDSQLRDAQTQIAKITSSLSWKITLPLREGWRWLKSLSTQAKRYLKGAAKLVKAAYLRLPLSRQTRVTLRHFVEKHTPEVLSAFEEQSVTMPAFLMPALEALQLPIKDFDLVAKSIKLKTSLQPVVSVIIPIYGKCGYTLRCLASIAASPPSIPFEVIVVDDYSPDNSAKVLKRVAGIQLISNTKNQGFIHSCNIGAKAATGQYLYFLNNDTVVTPGWLDELVRTFHEFPGTGLVGSKLVYPDGTLQEAGGIIWQDGSAWNFGRFQDPLLPVYNYAREVDYCSGASIMIPKALFEDLGGFDKHYLPAYCEDADIALKIRDKGYRVIYQPLSTVIHYEGITSGTDTSQGTKAYQIENSKKLFERWKGQLQAHQPAGIDADNAKDRRATRRVLVIDLCTPTPNQDAGSVTIFNLMLLLREMDFQVTFIPADNFSYMPEYTAALQRVGIEAQYGPYVTNVAQYLKNCGDRYDLAFLFRPGVAEHHLKTIHKFCPKAKVLYHTVDLHFLRMSREAELQSDEAKQKVAAKMKQCELTAIRASDASIVHSTAELEFLRPELPDAKLLVFPLILDVPGTSKTFSERRNIVFIGGFQHTPNVDAVQYFVAEIMPLLRMRLPGVRFYAVGSKQPAEIQALACEDVIITGFVEDLTPLLDTMRVSVAPLRYGAGIKGKIGTAMAVGLPTVATSLAVEGMSLTQGENTLVADGAEQFADAIVRLYQDEALWDRISLNGLEFAEKAWGAEAARRIFEAILIELGYNPIRYPYPIKLWSPMKNYYNRVIYKR